MAGKMTAKLRLRDNWNRLRDQVADSCFVAGRDADSVRVIAVTKYVDIQVVRDLFEIGCHDFGESRPQELWSKAQLLAQPDCSSQGVEWHLVGHLQRNKVKRTLGWACWIHSVDSRRLLEQLEQDAASLNIHPTVLLEVNLTQDASKTGCSIDELERLAEYAVSCRYVQVVGLMGMSSQSVKLECGAKDTARREFAELRRFRDRLQSQYARQLRLNELSMGMSTDFREAIIEGATMIRVGSALFEGIESKPH